MKTILVATDFSSAAENAAKYAADMAAVLGARLYLLNVYNIPASYSDVPLALNANDMMQEAEKNLLRLKDKLDERVRSHVPMETEVRMGLFLSELKETCERIKPYLVVLGSQGTTATERFFFGSHAVHAMQQLSWPLLTVPPEARFSAIKRIGLATDLEKVVDLVPADALKTLVNDFRAELHILHTGKSSRFDPETVFESGLLQEMIGDLKPEYHFITVQDTDQGIIDFADNNQVDMLVVLPRKHGLLEKLVHKSHTKQLVLHSHVPVMGLHNNA